MTPAHVIIRALVRLVGGYEGLRLTPAYRAAVAWLSAWERTGRLEL